MLLLIAYDEVFAVYNRFTGEKVAEKLFKASRTCPRHLGTGGGDTYKSYVETEKPARWAKRIISRIK